MGERNSPTGVDGRIELLANRIAEDGADEAETGFKASDGIAVGKIEFLAVDSNSLGSVDNAESNFGRKIVENPDVMVADEPCNLHTRIGKFGEGAEEADVAAGDYRAVLVPIIENVAQEIKPCRVAGDRVQPVDHRLLVGTGIGDVGCTEVDIAYEIGGSAQGRWELGVRS